MIPPYIPIVLAFTPNYVVPAATTILSVLDNLAPNFKLKVICLSSQPLSEEIKGMLYTISKERLSFSFIDLSKKHLNVNINNRFTEAALYRLLLPDLLPYEDKVIYLDSDVIVRTDLSKLFFQANLDGYYLAAVVEATLPFQEEYINNLGLKPGEYINSGFLILNLKKLREENVVRKLLEESNVEGLLFPDQDAINKVCQGKILPIQPIYNSIRTYFLPQYKKTFLKYYKEEDWEAIQSYGNIHYTGGKPWKMYTVQFDKWWDYYERLPAVLKKNSLFSKSQRIYFLYKLLKINICREFFLLAQNIYRFLRYKNVNT